ncbi:hypothetical protein VTK73DRAFT_4739 [Phialemonium thermophilum]|uniref:Uncharacterized protein n=1 Tax=Phialemonium thermophilum TaxID=223376 RepID=A0ABR3V699_9PEZI
MTVRYVTSPRASRSTLASSSLLSSPLGWGRVPLSPRSGWTTMGSSRGLFRNTASALVLQSVGQARATRPQNVSRSGHETSTATRSEVGTPERCAWSSERLHVPGYEIFSTTTSPPSRAAGAKASETVGLQDAPSFALNVARYS